MKEYKTFLNVPVVAENIKFYRGRPGTRLDPPEGPEIDFDLFFVVDDNKKIPVPDELYESLYDEILDATAKEREDREQEAREYRDEEIRERKIERDNERY